MKVRKGLKRKNPWKRVTNSNQYFDTPAVMHYLNNLVDKRPMFQQLSKNTYLGIHTKKAALKASPFVVGLISYSGENEMIQGCGTIIESDNTNTGIVLTSANLVRRVRVIKEGVVVGENFLADNLKVIVKLFDGTSCEGEVLTHDFHFNIAAIRFKSDSPVATAKIRRVDDSMDLNPSTPEEKSFQIHSHSSVIKLVPGNAVIAVGRYFAKPCNLMAAPGEFRVARCRYDCKELFFASCKITRCGDGCPLINRSGEVIGISFFDRCFTPFLPINIAYKWWELYKNGEFRRPSLGMEVANFYTADLDIADKFMQRFPGISKGVIVEKVKSGSTAEAAGLRLNDVVIQCAGKEVQGFLEFLEILWDNVGHLVELVVARVDHSTPLPLNMMVAELPSDKLNRWPYRE